MAEKVLLVDDEVGILNALERLLRKDKYEIIKANGGQAGVDTLDSEKGIAVIICDQRMPDVPGLQVLNHCRKVQPKTIRIALTGYCDADTILGCLNEAQVNQFLLKPWDDSHLRDIVRHAVSNYVNDREHRRLLGVVKEQYDKIRSHNAELEDKVNQRTMEVKGAKQLIEHTLREFSSTLTRVIEVNMPSVSGHGVRVARIAKSLGEKIGLNGSDLAYLEYAATVHDLGLVSVPAEILAKPEGQMNLNERKVFHRHALTGYELLCDIDGFDQVAKIARHHHEAFNGDGFPDELMGEEIPLGSRIIAVADLFDGEIYPMDRLTVRTVEAAKARVAAESGKLLDPNLVKLFLAHLESMECGRNPNEVSVRVGQLAKGMVLAKNLMNLEGKTVLKEQTTLDDETIKGLAGNRNIDPVSTRIFVTVDSLLRDPEEEEAALIAFAQEENAPPQMPKKVGPKPVVFVVDDEPYVVHALRRELHRAGYQVESFTTPATLLEALQAPPKHLIAIITDFNMPGIKGDLLISRIHRNLPKLPCIVITGETTRETIQRLIDLGTVHSILRKPWDKDKLLKTLSSICPDHLRESVNG